MGKVARAAVAGNAWYKKRKAALVELVIGEFHGDNTGPTADGTSIACHGTTIE
jgi:hypothetical protein